MRFGSGAALLAVGFRLGAPRTGMLVLGGVACFALRMISVWQHWNLPHAALPK